MHPFNRRLRAPHPREGAHHPWGTRLLPGGVVEILCYAVLRRPRGQVPGVDDSSARRGPVLRGNLHLVAQERCDQTLGENRPKHLRGYFLCTKNFSHRNSSNGSIDPLADPKMYAKSYKWNQIIRNANTKN